MTIARLARPLPLLGLFALAVAFRRTLERYTVRMAIIDEELFVHCARCGSEVATGIRRSVEDLAERPPGRRRIVCHRCGHVDEYGDGTYYHRTVESDRERVEA